MNLDDSGTGAAPKIPYRRKYRLLRSELIGEGRDINASGVEIDTRDREKIPNHPWPPPPIIHEIRFQFVENYIYISPSGTETSRDTHPKIIRFIMPRIF